MVTHREGSFDPVRPPYFHGSRKFEASIAKGFFSECERPSFDAALDLLVPIRRAELDHLYLVEVMSGQRRPDFLDLCLPPQALLPLWFRRLEASQPNRRGYGRLAGLDHALGGLNFLVA